MYKKESCAAGFSACGGLLLATCFLSAAVRSTRSVLCDRKVRTKRSAFLSHEKASGILIWMSGAFSYGSDRPSWVSWSFSIEKRKRAKYNPPAMRVRDVCYTKNHLSVIIGLFRPLLKKGKVIAWQSKRIRSHIRSGCVSITSSSPLSIEEKLFTINIKEICGISWNNCAVTKEWRYWKGIWCLIMCICW